jgi:hypothetical protein
VSSKDVADAIRRIVAVRDGKLVTVGYEQAGMSYPGASLAPYDARPNLGGKRGQADDSGSGTAGIASPLVETDASKRTYYEPGLVHSDYSLFAILVHPIKSMEMVDAKGSPVTLQFAEPPRNAAGEWDIV